MKIVWTRINKPYMYGWETTLGYVRVECVRAEEGRWEIFCFRGSKQLSHARNELPPAQYTHVGYTAAKNEAERLLRNGHLS